MAQPELLTRGVAPTRKITYEEFLDWCDEDTWAEWADGEVELLSPAAIPHQQLAVFLVFLLHLFTKTFNRGIVLTAPTQMKLGPDAPGREPDILFVATEHRDRVLRNRINGPADLVIEIVSAESIERDRVRKFAEYEAAGVLEYWILDQDRRDATFYQLGADGRYRRVAPDEAGIYRPAVLPGFWLRVDWLWQEPLPDLEAARELGLLG